MKLARNPIVLKFRRKADDNNTVMKVLFMVSILLCSFQSLWASDLVFNFEKFKRLPYEEKVQLVKAYQKLSAKIDESLKKTTKFKFSMTNREQFFDDFQTYAKLTQQFFISEAVAENFNIDKKCAFAGWVANYDSKGVCNLTAVKKDPNYSSGACGTRNIQCNPMLFGKNGNKPLCVDAYSPGNRGASYQCMVLSSQVADPAKNMREIIANIMADPQSFYQLALVLQRLCLCENEDAKGKNIYRGRIHTDLQNSTCVGLIKQLQNLLNQKNDSEDKLSWFCAEDSFSGQANQKTIQKDLAGIKAIVDKLNDEKKYDETLKAVCGPKVTVVGTPVLTNEPVSTPPVISVVCTEGDCPEDKPTTTTTNVTSPSAISTESSIALNLVTSQKANGNKIEISVDDILCKSMKTPKTYVEGNEGCTLTWAAPESVKLELDNGVLWNSIPRSATEFAITITLSDGKDQVVSTETIPALDATTIDETSTSAIALTTDDAIDWGSDTVPPPPQFSPLNLGPPFMFMMPGVN